MTGAYILVAPHSDGSTPIVFMLVVLTTEQLFGVSNSRPEIEPASLFGDVPDIGIKKPVPDAVDGRL